MSAAVEVKWEIREKPETGTMRRRLSYALAEGRLLPHRLGARIDHPVADLLVRGPVRDEPPAHDGELALIVLETDDRGRLGRGDVVPRRQCQARGGRDAEAASDVVKV